MLQVSIDDDNVDDQPHSWMTDPSFHNQMAWSVICIAPVIPILHSMIGKSSSYGKLVNTVDDSNNDRTGTDSSQEVQATNISHGLAMQDQRKRNRHPFGPMLPSKWSWMFFECPNLIWAVVSYYQFYHGPSSGSDTVPVTASITSSSSFYSSSSSSYVRLAAPNSILLLWFFLHYLHRAVIYPLNMSNQSKFPMGLTLMAFCYTSVNR